MEVSRTSAGDAKTGPKVAPYFADDVTITIVGRRNLFGVRAKEPPKPPVFEVSAARRKPSGKPSLTAFACQGRLRRPAGAHRGGRRGRGAHVAQPFEGSPRTLSGAASGYSSRGRGASKGWSRRPRTKRPSAPYAPPRAGAWLPRRGKDGRPVRKAKAAAGDAEAPAKPAKKKRSLSREGRARIVAGPKRRGNQPCGGVKYAARTSTAKKSAPAVAPRKAVGRTKAASKRPAAGRVHGGNGAAPPMAEAAAGGAPAATAE